MVSETGNLVCLRVEPENFPHLLNVPQAGDRLGDGPRIACDPSSVQVAFDGLFHDDVHVAGLGEHDDGLGGRVRDGLHQAVEPAARLRDVLGEVVGQDVQKFHAGGALFPQEGSDLFTAELPVCVVAAYDAHCSPLEQTHQVSNGQRLVRIARYGSQESGELQLLAELLASR